MDQSDALQKARQFADTAYNAATETISKQSNEKLQAKRAELAARGMVLSGAMTAETARINGERFTALLQARLNALLEGCDLHGVQIDDQLSQKLIDEIMDLRETMTAAQRNSASVFTEVGGAALYGQLLDQNIDVSANSVRTQIDRRRLMPKTTGPSSITNIYHVHGHNARWNVNSSDHSVNVVTTSREQVFASLRQQLESGIPAGEERSDILQRLTTLEQAQSSPSFSQRYVEFISAAANHMALIGPFIPALTELLQKTLGS